MIFTAFRFDWNIKITHSHSRNGNVFDSLKSHPIDEIQLGKVWRSSQLRDWHQKCVVDKILTHHQRLALLSGTIVATPASFSHLTMAESITFLAVSAPVVIERVSYHQFSLFDIIFAPPVDNGWHILRLGSQILICLSSQNFSDSFDDADKNSWRISRSTRLTD